MIIILFTILALVVSAILLIVFYKKDYETTVSFLTTFVFGASLLGELIGVACSHGTARNEYNKLIYQKEVLEYRLENDGLVGNELLYRDITDFNNTIREARYWYENPWTSWFCSGLIPSIDYIELDMNNNA